MKIQKQKQDNYPEKIDKYTEKFLIIKKLSMREYALQEISVENGVITDRKVLYQNLPAVIVGHYLIKMREQKIGV